MVWKTSAEAAEAEAIAHCALWNGGRLRIYSGTRPATVATALSGNTLLAEFTLSNPAYTAGTTDGVVTLAGAPLSATAVATGTATFARIFKSDGTTAVDDVDVGTSGTEIVLVTTSIVTNLVVDITSGTFTWPLT
jgi:hypothetical protein